MKNKFKVGDMVEFIGDNNFDMTTGRDYEVQEIFAGGHLLNVINDSGIPLSYHIVNFKPSNQKPMNRDTKGRFSGKDKRAGNISDEVLQDTLKDIWEAILELKNSLPEKNTCCVKDCTLCTNAETPKEVVQSGFFEPKESEEYFYICCDGRIIEGNNKSLFDKDTISIGNCFRTEQDARDHLEYLKAIRRIKKYIHENGMSFSPNYDTDQKHFPYYDTAKKVFSTNWTIVGVEFQILPALSSRDHLTKIIQDCASDLEIIKEYSMSHNF